MAADLYSPKPTAPSDWVGWAVLAVLMVMLAWSLPATHLDPSHTDFFMLIGFIGIWRYGLGLIHFARSMLFLHWRFPRLRKQADALGEQAMPSHVYLLVTSFRIDPVTTGRVYRAAIEEAVRCKLPVTIVASIVEMADQRLLHNIWQRLAPPSRVSLRIVRIPGTGKRDGLAHGFRVISRSNPPADALVAVIDGDTALAPGVIRRCAPFFKLLPTVGGLTTNEFCDVQGGYAMTQWHRLRFAQRHLYMGSMALSHRVLTLTGRMSMFRASIVTDPRFIDDVQNDSLDHWRLGRFRFLTGDDKSSWFSLMRLGHDTFYVPDAVVHTMEHPPSRSFVASSRQLMFRWCGNSLRQNSRATRLGPRRLGWFTYYVLWDQRISMWTCLLGPSLALAGSWLYGPAILVAYLLWILTTRVILTLSLTLTGHSIGPAYPLLLYYNQILGSLMKIYVFHRLDRQSWTRQKTHANRDLGAYDHWFNVWSSHVMHFTSASVFAALVFSMV